jgi:hypothetical protein
MSNPATSTATKSKKITIEFDTEELTPHQVRLIRTLNMMLANVIVAEEEAEFFEGSAEFMKLCAALIKQSKFTEKMIKENNIPYAEQALEYSVDILQEAMTMSKVVSYDN